MIAFIMAMAELGLLLGFAYHAFNISPHGTFDRNLYHGLWAIVLLLLIKL